MMRASRSTLTALATLALLASGLVSASTPALAVAPEAPVTQAATAVTGTSATLNGELNPGAGATTGYEFTYSTNGSCTEGLVTEPGAEASGKAIKVSTPVTGLEGSTEYTFCVVATNSEAETTSGAPLKFKTPAAAPAVAPGEVLGLTPTTASVFEFLDAESQPTSCVYEYGTTTAYGSSTPCEPATLGGAGQQFVTAAFAGLEAGTTYHYRIVATNLTGETKGADAELTTPPLEAPIVDGESVTGLTSTDATLNAQVNPNYQETTYTFEYATNEALSGATTVSGANALPAEFGDQLASADIGGGLQPHTTYYYRIVATNGTGPTQGPIEQFTTLGLPIVATGEARGAARTTATLSGAVNPSGAPTTYHFAYIDQAAYEAAVAKSAVDPYAEGGRTAETEVGSDSAQHGVGPLVVSELRPGVTYHYAVVATNSVGTVFGSDATFTTMPPTPPIASTGAAIAVTQLSAALTGTVDTRELQSTLEFEFGTSPYAGSLVSASVIAGSESGSTVGISTFFQNNLQPSTTYYYRAIATNADGTSYGAEQSFTTGSFPPAFTLSAGLAPLAYTSIAVLNAKEAREGKVTTVSKPLTRAQKLAKALKACKKTRSKQKKAACVRSARKKYGPVKK
jgi:hypothetical protein